MTCADVTRFIIIISLGVVSFITFLVAGTIIGLMWLDSFSCVTCKRYPVGIYILGVLGILYLISIGIEASEAPEPWQKWVKENWVTLAVAAAAGIAAAFVMTSGG
jgi:hypothetical protein